METLAAPVARALTIDIREPATEPRRVQVTDPVEIGRGLGLSLSDPAVSRRHLRLWCAADGTARAIDLGSRHGSRLNGRRLPPGEEATLVVGDVIRLGDTDIVLAAVDTVRPELAPPAGLPRPDPVGGPVVEPRRALDERPRLDDLASSVVDGVAVVRFRPGSEGERYAGEIASRLRRARRRLRGFGTESWGVLPQVCLVDPFPDPDDPAVIVTAGTVVDERAGAIWMAVSAEAPPEPVERALTLLFGSALPAAGEVGWLLEGYGLHLAGVADPNPSLRDREVPAWTDDDATIPAEVWTAMQVSFVRHLIEQRSEDEFRRFLSTARPGALDAAAREVFGVGLHDLDTGWRAELEGTAAAVGFGQFARLAWRYMRPHRRREAEMLVHTLFGMAFALVFPFAMRNLLDDALPSGRFAAAMGTLGVLAGALVVTIAAGLRRAQLSAYVSGAVVRDLRNGIFQRLQHLGARWYHDHNEGDVLARLLSDVQIVEQGLSQTLREGLVHVVGFTVGAVVLVLLHPGLAAVVLLAAPLLAVVYRLMSTGAQRRSRAAQEQLGGVVGIATENHAAQPVVRAFGLEGREQARFARAGERLFTATRRLQLWGGLFGLSLNLVTAMLRIAVLALGSWMIVHDHLTIGALVAFVGIMGEVLDPVTALTSIGQQVQYSTGSLARLSEILDAEPEIVDDPAAPDLPALGSAITFERVSFSYGRGASSSGRQVLSHVDLVIPAGQRVAFVGPSGAGKSSVLALLQRVYDPDEGAVRFDGHDVRDVRLRSLREQIGVVFQDTFCFDGTIRENIAMGRASCTDHDIEQAARAAELHDFVASLPAGYDTPVGARGSRLSGGQRQRLALARALVRNPRVLVLDEATSALDPRTERLITDTLERVAVGRTTVAVTHRLASVVGYDRIYVLREGRVAEAGTHEELVARGGLYAQLWAEQTGLTTGEAPFDATAALVRLPLFAAASDEELAATVARLRTVELAAGERRRDGDGSLAIIRRGSARVHTAASDGRLVPSATLGVGDAFGLSALLAGSGTSGAHGTAGGMGCTAGATSELEATTAVVLLVLDAGSLRGLAATAPSVRATLAGAVRPAHAPSHGRRLTRMTGVFAPPSSDALVALTPPTSRLLQ